MRALAHLINIISTKNKQWKNVSDALILETQALCICPYGNANPLHHFLAVAANKFLTT